MDDIECLQNVKPGECLLLSAYWPSPMTFDIPLFFEPLNEAALRKALDSYGLVGVVIDGDGPLGRAWITKFRALTQMLDRNVRHFGDTPYFYAFRYVLTRRDYDPSSPKYDKQSRELQYLVYTQGAADPASRLHVALAMLRQWQAKGVPNHYLERIESKYFDGRSALPQAPGLHPLSLQGQHTV